MLETVTTLERGGFTREELSSIDAALRRGESMESIWRMLDIPQSTFYYRLKQSGKRIETKTFRFIVDNCEEGV